MYKTIIFLLVLCFKHFLEKIMNDMYIDVNQKAVEKWGKNKQVLCTIEEMNELSKELLKDVNRKESNREKIVEEIGDLLIMLNQLKIIYNIKDHELTDTINRKMEKIKHRIETLD